MHLAGPSRLASVLFAGLVATTVLAPVVIAQDRGAATTTAVNRGIDLWLYGHSSAPAGGRFDLSVVALGFPTATTLTPLQGASVEAAWDPTSLTREDEPKLAVAPPPVLATTDAGAAAMLEIPVPPGSELAMRLVVRVKVGDKERTKELTVQRKRPDSAELFVSDTAVVPGSEVTAWALFEGARAKPGGGDVEVVLTQGDVVRHRTKTKTDASGTAWARVPIPRSAAAESRYSLDVRRLDADGAVIASASTTLRTREENPGKPSVNVRFSEGWVAAGSEAEARVRIRDGAGEALRNHPVRVWTGPKGTAAPSSEEAFDKVATKLESNDDGEVVTRVKAPSTVPRSGTELSLELRTEIEGQTIVRRASVEVGEQRGTVTITPESGELLRGRSQRVVFQLTRDRGEPLVGTFTVKGDGLDARFTTNAHGEAEVTWQVPRDAGAFRDVGPCPGNVAVGLTVRAVEPSDGTRGAFGGALVGPDGLATCVPVRREEGVLLRPAKLVVRPGEKLDFEVFGAPRTKAAVLALPTDHPVSTTTNVDLASGKGSLTLDPRVTGPVDLHLAVPRADGPTVFASARVLVLPTTLPRVTGQLVSGKAAPGSTVTIDADLTDEGGKPLVGAIAAIAIDKFGGGSLESLRGLDTRTSLCRSIDAREDRCDELLGGSAASEPKRRALLTPAAAPAPLSDPAATAKKRFDETFQVVVRSLEGAVYESAMSVETLADARRREGKGFTFNPELMTLVTDAIPERPETPGGEPITLADLIAKDPQITFDNVARRVTRLKLFEALNAMRSARVGLDPDEPLLAEPNVLLRKLVREGTLTEASLLDPWGGKLSFQRSDEEYVPFISFRRGFSLRSPGPDGKLGSRDDVTSPFERVLKSGTPYADASFEDEVVDARWDMAVADATVASWQSALNRATGTELGGGRGEGIGLGGIGTGGGGSGYGYGHGGLYGASRVTGAGFASMTPPVPTDERGRARISIQLGDEETTWQIALVGLPRDAKPAVSSLEVPVTLPLSSKVFAGARMTEGDRSNVIVRVRNRTDAPLAASLRFTASGALTLEPGSAARDVQVPARGAASIEVAVEAGAGSGGALSVTTSAPGVDADVVRHEIEVEPAGRLMNVARTAWVSEERDLTPLLHKRPFLDRGPAKLTLSRGVQPHLDAATRSLDRLEPRALDELADFVALARTLSRRETFGRAEPAELERLAELEAGALARLDEEARGHALAFSFEGRVGKYGQQKRGEPFCPPPTLEVGRAALASALDAEPPIETGNVLPCWTQLAARAVTELEESSSARDVARAVLALEARPHRATELATLRERLQILARPDEQGKVALASREELAMVHSAFIATASGPEAATVIERHLPWLLVQRDATGGFGSAAATRAAVTALLRVTDAEGPAAKVTVDLGEAGERELLVPHGRSVELEIPASADVVELTTSAPLLAVVSRDYLRPFAIAPTIEPSALRLDMKLPSSPECGEAKGCAATLRRSDVGNLILALSSKDGPEPVEVKIPLPPGVVLAESTANVRQVQGALYVRETLQAAEKVLTIPLRFNLSGTFTAREVELRSLEDRTVALFPARTITVAPR